MDALEVVDWRRRTFALYAEVRAAADPAEGHAHWVRGRDALFADHPASPLLPERRAGFAGLPVPAYDPAFRFEVELRPADPEPWSVETGTDGTVAFERVGVADLEPVIAEADWSALAGAVTQFGRQRALVVLLTPLEPAAVEEGLLPVLPSLTRHHRVVLASVRDPELERLAATRGTIDEVYDAAAAEQAMIRRRHTAELLRAVGLDVVDADAERLPPALADHYLSLKARGLL